MFAPKLKTGLQLVSIIAGLIVIILAVGRDWATFAHADETQDKAIKVLQDNVELMKDDVNETDKTVAVLQTDVRYIKEAVTEIKEQARIASAADRRQEALLGRIIDQINK